MSNSILLRISRILAGDRAAVAWLYDTFAPRLLRRLGQRFGGMRGLDREDLLQDTFLYVLKENGRVLERFRGHQRGSEPREVELEHFLWSAACGIASNRRRSLLRHPAASLDGPELEPEVSGEGSALARDALERLADCLLRNGDRLELYFQLRYRDGHKPAEIARITGWSQRTTYKLKQALDEALDHCIEVLELSMP
ncbi:MAG: hypothetical protein AAF657_27815 [Acidobacteriota bacterium]